MNIPRLGTGMLFLLMAQPHIAAAARGDLIASHLRYRLSAAQVAEVSARFGSPQADYPVDVYEVVYRTLDGKGREVSASGAVAVPVGAPPMPVVSVQHGTVFPKDAVPSRLPLDLLDGGLLFAGSGYLAVMPDYVGYGRSAKSFHPYLHARSLAVSIVDMLRAVRSFCSHKGLRTDGQLFLIGYSEGGYATMAAHREIETRLDGEFQVTASAPIAGPYDPEATLEVLLRRPSTGSVPFLAFGFWAYDRIYGLDRLRGILREPYRSEIERLFGGSPSSFDLERRLPSRAADLFEPGFLRAWSENGAHRVKEVARENSLTDWTPQAPLTLFHCSADTVVPVENSRIAFDLFNRRGAPVRLVERDLGDHAECFAPLIAQAKAFFDSVRNGLKEPAAFPETHEPPSHDRGGGSA